MSHEDAVPFRSWQARSNVMRTQVKCPQGSRPWTSRARLRGLPPRARVVDLVDVAYASRLASKPPGTRVADLTKNFFVDVSQGVERKPWRDGLMTIRKNTVAYSYERDCTLSGTANLLLLGWSARCCPDSLTESDLRHLAGNG